MTTIVYKDDIIAVDSRATATGLITNDNTNKIIKHNGVVFILTGALCDFGELIKAYFGQPHEKKVDADAIIDDKGTIFRASICENDGFWKQNITGQIFAIGSGRDHAWTAMDLGLSAIGAVRMAAKRDVYTGGRIRTHKVKTKPLTLNVRKPAKTGKIPSKVIKLAVRKVTDERS